MSEPPAPEPRPFNSPQQVPSGLGRWATDARGRRPLTGRVEDLVGGAADLGATSERKGRRDR
jgi:hypothetical protein